MQTRFPLVLVSGAAVASLGASELRKLRKENFSQGFRLFITRYHASFEVWRSEEQRRRKFSVERNKYVC